MQYNRTMDGKSLILAITPALLGFLGVGVGAVLSHRGQHRHWLRERKIEAVSAYVENMSLLIDRFREADPPPGKRAEWLHGMQSGRTTIHLLCAQPAREAADELARTTKEIEIDKSPEAFDDAIAALRRFVELARQEINPRREPWSLL